MIIYSNYDAETKIYSDPASTSEQLFKTILGIKDYNDDTLVLKMAGEFNDVADNDNFQIIIKVYDSEDTLIDSATLSKTDLNTTDVSQELDLDGIDDYEKFTIALYYKNSDGPAETLSYTINNYVFYTYNTDEPTSSYYSSLIEDVKEQAEKTGTEDDNLILSVIEVAESAIEQYIKTNLYTESHTDILMHLSRAREIVLTHNLNVLDVIVYDLDDNEIDVDVDYTSSAGIVYLSYALTGSFKIVYNSGYSEGSLPDALYNAIVDTAVYLYKFRKQGIELVSSRNLGEGLVVRYRRNKDFIPEQSKLLCRKYVNV
jgi:hypothetical protein